MDTRSFSIGLLAVSLICLSGSIVFFTIQFININREIPEILTGVEKAAEKVETVAKEAERMREVVPSITKEISETRKQVPSILKEVSELRKQIPAVLKEVHDINQKIPAALKEVKEIRALVPLVLDEVKKTREAIPSMLLKADNIVKDAKQISKTATESAVTGVFTGIIKAPFEIVGSLGNAIFGGLGEDAEEVTEEDLELIKLTTYQVLSTAKPADSSKWSNPQSGNNGTVTMKQFAEIDERDCRILNYTIRIDHEGRINKDVSFCLDEDSIWKPIEQ